MSSKRPVGRYKMKTGKKYKPRDPRFDEMCGEFNSHAFKQAYSFIDDMKKDELEQLEKKAAKTKLVPKKQRLKRVIQRYVWIHNYIYI